MGRDAAPANDSTIRQISARLSSIQSALVHERVMNEGAPDYLARKPSIDSLNLAGASRNTRCPAFSMISARQ